MAELGQGMAGKTQEIASFWGWGARWEIVGRAPIPEIPISNQIPGSIPSSVKVIFYPFLSIWVRHFHDIVMIN
jgi:hypothetical protein